MNEFDDTELRSFLNKNSPQDLSPPKKEWEQIQKRIVAKFSPSYQVLAAASIVAVATVIVLVFLNTSNRSPIVSDNQIALFLLESAEGELASTDSVNDIGVDYLSLLE